MCSFQVESPFDAAFNTINSFRHLSTDEMAGAHLAAMARSVRSGGIYVLGLHLTPTECEPDDNESWVSRRGHLQVNTSMWLLERNLPERFETFAITFDVFTPTRQFRIRDQLQFRTYTLPQFRNLLATVPEFEVVEIFDFAYDEPIELDARTQDAVFVLGRK